MKIILSRKGFDSQYGGIPSPIFEDLGPVSLPIPINEGIELSRCQIEGRRLVKVVSDLGAKGVNASTLVHLDPDLCATSIDRQAGWLPSFGQSDAAQGHLVNQLVGVGDLFLFFGWFQHVRYERSKWIYAGPREGFHALFGWLQVDRVIDVDAEIGSIPVWLHDHPHVLFQRRLEGKKNTIYVARKALSLPQAGAAKGAGRFGKWHESLRLSQLGRSRSHWNLPSWIHPTGKGSRLSYHGNPERWRLDGQRVLLKTVGKGQEFVLDATDYPEALNWAAKLISSNAVV